MNISVCIPTYNEGEKTLRTVEEVKRELIKTKCVEDFEIIVSDGSSEDNTVKLLTDRAEGRRVKVVTSNERSYYGESIKECFRLSKHDYFIVIDGDGSVRPGNLDKMLTNLKENDVVLGRRKISDRKKLRGILSYSYNKINRLVFDSKVKDHQCGFKGFNRDSVERLFNRTRSDHWYWDTEILLRAQKQDLKVKEIDIAWKIEPNSKVNLVTDSIMLLKKTLEFRLLENSWIKRYYQLSRKNLNP